MRLSALTFSFVVRTVMPLCSYFRRARFSYAGCTSHVV